MLITIRLLFIVTVIAFLFFVSFKTVREPTTYVNNVSQLANFPELPENYDAIQFFFKGIDSWATDRMHYRQQFITWLNTARYALGYKQVGQVIAGKDEWLFFDGGADRENEDARGATQFTSEELEHWKKYLLYVNSEAKKHGAKYIFLMLPNKSTVYSEYLPDNFTRLSNNTRIQQLVDLMKDTDVSVLDARAVLFEGKNAGQIYLKNDTHWNMLGANYVQHKIMVELAKTYPDIRPQLFSFHDASPEERLELHHPADLSYMMGIRLKDFEPQIPVVEGVGACVGHNHPENMRQWPLAVGDCSHKSTRQNDAMWYNFLDKEFHYIQEETRDHLFHGTVNPLGHHSLIMMNDSYFEMLQPYFSNQFQYARFISFGRPPVEIWVPLLTTIKPDIVLEESLERYLKSKVPKPGVDYPAP